MVTEYRVTGERRLDLIRAIEAYTGECSTPLPRPEGGTAIGPFTVTAEGALEFSDWTDSKLVEGLYEAIDSAGFEPHNGGMTVTIPREFFTESALINLRKIVDSKAALLKKALGTDRLDIIESDDDDDEIQFPWFPEPNADEFVTYAQLIDSLCEMARKAKRVVATERPVESEKYAMRCFLIRLGFTGPENKKARKILLRNLTGSAAFQNQEKANAFSEKLKAKRRDSKTARSDAT